jgi:hypothetical protein
VPLLTQVAEGQMACAMANEEVVAKTESFFRTHYPSCTLMPVRSIKGAKAPAAAASAASTSSWTVGPPKAAKAPGFDHKGSTAASRWKVWDDRGRDACLRGAHGCEAGAVLVLLYGPEPGDAGRGLVVIDVDDHDLVEDLCARFPRIRDTSVQATRKGKHFFFERTDLCERHNVVDRPGGVHYPVRPVGAPAAPYKIDVKTSCSTGTGGAVVVAPSPNKTWERPPWTHPPLPIPDDFLTFLLDHMPSQSKSVKARGRAASSSSVVVPSVPSVSRPSVLDTVGSAAADEEREIRTLVERCWSNQRASAYADWLRAGLSLFNAGGFGDRYLALWIAFSRRGGDAFKDEDDCRRVWATFERTGGEQVGLGSIRYWARLDNPDVFARLSRGNAWRTGAYLVRLAFFVLRSSFFVLRSSVARGRTRLQYGTGRLLLG